MLRGLSRHFFFFYKKYSLQKILGLCSTSQAFAQTKYLDYDACTPISALPLSLLMFVALQCNALMGQCHEHFDFYLFAQKSPHEQA